MGQTLSFPATWKTSESGGDDRFAYGISEMQGWRITMEDSHTVQLQLDEDKRTRNAFFAVYDGHGGGTVAKYAGKNLYKRLAQEPAYLEGQYQESLKNTFLGTDEDIRNDPAFTRDTAGCTAVAALVTEDNKIYLANAGDSRSVIGIKGEAKPLSYDHKPTNKIEMARISGAGGYVEYGRVNGNLALARALGDFEYKKNKKKTPEEQIITSNPEILEHEITEEDEFLILACDGIWDCLTSQQCVDVVRLSVSQGKELSEICEIICEHCLAPDTSSGAGIGCDNMTVLIVAILHGRTKEEWYDWVTDRVKNNDGYNTPDALPQLYSQLRLKSFQTKREAEEAREKARLLRKEAAEKAALENPDALPVESPSIDGGIIRMIGGTAGISFHPGGSIISDSGSLTFEAESDDDSDDNMDTETGNSGSYSGLKEESSDATKSLKEQLDELDRDVDSEGSKEASTGTPPAGVDGASGSEEGQSTEGSDVSPSPETKSEIPPPSKAQPNGISEETHSTQVVPPTGSDEPSPAVQVEEVSKQSEEPLKG